MPSDRDITSELDAELDAFYSETHIWPPGRDSAPEMGDPHGDGGAVAWDALVAWRKSRAQIARLEAEVREKDEWGRALVAELEAKADEWKAKYEVEKALYVAAIKANMSLTEKEPPE